MANRCDYEIHVKGNKKAALFFVAMMPVCDSKEITHEEGTDDEYVVWLKGNCNWSLDYRCTEKPDANIDLNILAEDDVRGEEVGLPYWYLTMRQKSELLNIEILAHSWSQESEYENYEHYKNGLLLDSKREAYPLLYELQVYDLFPSWVSSEYETYEAFCSAVNDFFGFSIDEIPEDCWEQSEDGVRSLTENAWLDFVMDYKRKLYPSLNISFAF